MHYDNLKWGYKITANLSSITNDSLRTNYKFAPKTQGSFAAVWAVQYCHTAFGSVFGEEKSWIPMCYDIEGFFNNNDVDVDGNNNNNNNNNRYNN